jgi:glycosyltransferase involved in cell wall biosynthesis
MHVVHVITRLIVGGAQENTILTCEGLHARGRRVTLISGPTCGPEGSLVRRAQHGGYDNLEVPELRRNINPWLDARARREMAAHLSDLRPDVVHTHSSKAGILGRFAARDARVPIIVHTIHGMSFNRTQPWWLRLPFRWLERRAARFTDALVCVADAMIEQSLAARIAPPERFVTIYSGMEVERFDPDRLATQVTENREGVARAEAPSSSSASSVADVPNRCDRAAIRQSWGFDDQHVVVGTIARLFRRKGYEQLLPIMAAAARREPRLRFVWVGDGAQRAEYESELARLGLRDHTVLTGLVPPERIPQMLAGFDILAHTSQWEGLPRTVVQAQLMRVPAVAFAIDGTPEVVLEGKTGRLIPLNDLEAFAAALVELAHDPEQRARMGAAGRASCLERFDWRIMVDQLEQLYERLTTKRRKRSAHV